nr:hypothetical protein [Nocardiopsis xinjiangensis]
MPRVDALSQMCGCLGEDDFHRRKDDQLAQVSRECGGVLPAEHDVGVQRWFAVVVGDIARARGQLQLLLETRAALL